MSAWGGISVVNAIPSGLGSAIAIDMKTKIFIRRCSNFEKKPSSRLVEKILEYFSSRYGLSNLCADVVSDIPMGSGLKSSSSVAVALIKAVKNLNIVEELDVPRLAAELSRLAGVSITGALDDAAAAYYGGVVFTDNTNMKVIRVLDPKLEMSVVILIPRGVSRPPMNVDKLRKYSHLFEEVFSIAIQGDIFRAMTLNGLLIARLMGYSEDVPRKALSMGASAAGVSGNGPATFAVCRAGDEGPIIEFFSRYGEVRVHRFVRVGETP
ncbi:shikimate kinase [Ignisphaera sp. 4213-co]|uniref:Shikimate kinase n=1 Tax=Ignisphaera cupida TaxID=3050454 RepID=A0ABD4Z6Z0_9CREN|nr:shikimate kinase [Ignisphaera sp. 4213-co]MDK6028090.1 shikimate kinase [Ignisphaera sp. 4213-co]